MSKADDLVKLSDPGPIQEIFAFGVGRIENLGSVSRITFYAPRTGHDGLINEPVFSLIVGTDQLGVIAAALVRPLGERLTAQMAPPDVLSVH